MLLSFEKYVQNGGSLSENIFLLYEKLSETELSKIAGGCLPDSQTVELCMNILISAYENSDNLTVENKAKQFSNDGLQVTLSYADTPESVLDTARKRVVLLFESAGIYKYLGVEHRV